MKKVILFFSLYFCFCTLQAQVISVVSPSGITTLVDNLEAAIEAAVPESMIYLPGNPAGFAGNVKINKKVHIVGVGYRDDMNPATGRTLINGNITFIPGSDQSSLIGVYLTGDVLIGETGLGTTGYIVNGLFIHRCNVNRVKQVTPNTSTPGGTSIMITQNIVRSGDNDLNVYNAVISNNIFIYSGVVYYIIRYTKGAIIANNIFLDSGILSGNTNYYFRNNICLAGIDGSQLNGGAYSTCNIICNTTQFENNYSNVSKDKIFKKWEGWSGFRYSDDYRLLDDCVGKGKGSDGTDVGIYGGMDPWKDGGIPFNPHIESAEIAPSTAADGTLNMKIKVTVDPQ